MSTFVFRNNHYHIIISLKSSILLTLFVLLLFLSHLSIISKTYYRTIWNHQTKLNCSFVKKIDAEFHNMAKWYPGNDLLHLSWLTSTRNIKNIISYFIVKEQRKSSYCHLIRHIWIIRIWCFMHKHNNKKFFVFPVVSLRDRCISRNERLQKQRVNSKKLQEFQNHRHMYSHIIVFG